MFHTAPILLYHNLAICEPTDDIFRLSVAPEKFAQQMAYLHQHDYQCLSLEELWQYRQTGRSVPKKSFAITFDDGYEDNYTVAYPILKRYGFTATIFIVTSFVGRSVKWPGEQMARFLDWDQIREMSDYGITFGGHTLQHVNLPDISIEQATQEICQSKQILESHLDRAVKFFAYPGGHQNEQLQQVVKDCGYLGACGVDIGASTYFNSWRVQLNTDDSIRLFQLKVSGWFEWLKQIRQRSKALWWVTQMAGKGLNRTPG